VIVLGSLEVESYRVFDVMCVTCVRLAIV